MQHPEAELVFAVERFIGERQLLLPNDTIVTAVSGGPDSTALLHVLHRLAPRYGWKLIAAHLNHQFRGAESEAEAELVASFASSLGVPCETGVADLPAWIRETGLNAQAAARDRRYAFLTEVAAKHGAERLALAHHADDQAETVLMRLVRGTGPSGLTGMPLTRRIGNLELVRPLLRIYKEELMGYCHEHSLPFAEDSSNRSRKYTRNRIRLDAMPALAGLNPQLPDALNRLADLMREEDDFLRQEAERARAALVTREDGGVAFSRNAFLALHVALQRRLIKLILNYVCGEPELADTADVSDYNRIERIREALAGERTPTLTIDLHGGFVFRRGYDRVWIGRRAACVGIVEGSEPAWLERDWLERGGFQWGDVLQGTVTARTNRDEASKDSSATEAFFDFDRLVFPLQIRFRRDGDRMDPLGLNGSKKVKDMFINKKIPLQARDRLPILEDAEGRILWIPGVGRSRHALLMDDTSRLLAVRIAPEAWKRLVSG
ncbi:tRNA lysidine(34) synthetase TilS [Paenibacillus koleovorans]|uniref:tRNA lysidine(34) synthetase TilS n=1 Tax=Paenibacillus koleovorans TaxID=121608 RepID=UPI000FD8403E|nr:tRNA lysidine(34) synthetase TilS [Paenibacillus koleovorans]